MSRHREVAPNVHFIESYLERAERVIAEAVVPIIETARRIGLTVIHAPSPSVACHYEQLTRHGSSPTVREPTWPPREFRCRQGEYAAFKGPRDQPPSVGRTPGRGSSVRAQK